MAAEISAKIVKELRDKTSAGMMDCKKALVEAGGDFDKAIDILRKKGQKIAEMGNTDADGFKLKFEIRDTAGKALNPVSLLPQR